MKPKQTSFSNKPVCYLESQGLQSGAQGSQAGLNPRPVFGLQDLHCQGLLSWGSLSSLLVLPASRKDANWVMSAGSRQSPGKGDEGGGIAFCQAPRPLHSFPRAWWGLQEIASECSTSPESSCGRAPFVLRYKQPPAVLFILEVPGVADDTLIYRLVPKDSACSLALCSPTAPSNWPALQSSSCLLTALN